ncbi:hypothetical protein [Cohaesibacter gelatinilyticus]|uniref:hypothetical protein n=1 Tax=Cohaesibacter gelatinilyticus TaxID=372072 RepID=UPI0011435CBF|nr:hypothetical protein [Cohaesibacter gelatinilyticus]
MSKFWRPERRNRRIGTKSSGYSQSNDMRIPSSWCDKTGKLTLFHELLERPYEMEAIIYGCDITILYETPKEGFSYGCSPADVIKLLKLVAIDVPPLPDIIVFRQPTRKQRQQNPVWGRFFYYSEFGKHKGSAIVLEAQKIGDSLIWPRRMSLEDRDEYNRLNDDGHRFVETKRDFRAELTEDAIRSTLLFRTFLHELGHWADYSYKVIFGNSAIDGEYDNDTAEDLYFARPTSEREVYAHAFADKYRKRLKNAGEIPFAPEPFELPERMQE